MILKEFNQIYDEEQREKLFQKNILTIKKNLQSIPPDVLKLHLSLIKEAAMYMTNLTEINDIITRDGLVSYYQNGANQWGTKKSVAADLKPKYTATLQSLLKQLTDLLPSENDKDAAAELMNFIGMGK